jgi:hypothetical protein
MISVDKLLLPFASVCINYTRIIGLCQADFRFFAFADENFAMLPENNTNCTAIFSENT